MSLKKLTLESFQQIIEAGEVNFIASAVSPWHAIGVNSLMLRLTEMNIKICPLFIVIQSPNEEYLLDSNSFNFDTKHVYRIDYTKNFILKLYQLLSPISSAINFVKNKYNSSFEKKVFIAAPWYPDFNRVNWFLKFNKRAKIIYCVIDEGVATYMPT